MGYNLTIDQGNSSAKVAVWDRADIIFDASFKQFKGEDIANLITRFPNIDKAVYCSVADEGNETIKFLNEKNIKTLILDHSTLLPITNAYKTPQSLGRDRIAAAVGAWSNHKNKDILVIDLGTAITYDVVTANGCYIGGNISTYNNWRSIRYSTRNPNYSNSNRIIFISDMEKAYERVRCFRN